MKLSFTIEIFILNVVNNSRLNMTKVILIYKIEFRASVHPSIKGLERAEKTGKDKKIQEEEESDGKR